MEMTDFWCINDEWENIQAKGTENSIELSDMGIGSAWAKEWRKNKSTTFTSDRKKCVCSVIGLEVWYYPSESKKLFYDWLAIYIFNKKNKLISCGKTAPVLPNTDYRKIEKYADKKVYFTGFYSADKETINNVIVPQTGIIVSKNFGSKCDFLILGRNKGGRKIKDAIQWGIPCISAEVFVEETTN